MAGDVTGTRPKPSEDVRALLGMHTRAARAIAVFFLCAETAMATSSWHDAHPHWPSVAALLIFAAATATLLQVPDPLPPWATAVLTVTPPAAAALVLITLPVPPSASAQLWPFGGGTAIATYMCVRGKTPWAWGALLSMIGVSIAWSASTRQGVMHGLAISDINLGPLLMATFFARTIRPAAHTVFALGRETARRDEELVDSTALALEYQQQQHHLRTVARPVLDRLAGPEPVDPVLQQECSLLEGHLRDILCAPGFIDERITLAVRHARERGVKVSLEDVHGFDSAAAEVRARLIPVVAELLEQAHTGTIKIRSQPPDRPWIATVVFDDPTGGAGRVEFDRDGRALPPDHGTML